MQTTEIQLRATTQEALELMCQALEAQYGPRVQLYRYRSPEGDWYARGSLIVLGARRLTQPLTRTTHRRIIIS